MYPTITRLTIETISGCNAECLICPNSRLEHRRKLYAMSLENFEKILKLFPNLKAISLCGCYEPLLDSRLTEIFDTIKKINSEMNITIFSNGSLLNKRYCDLLLNNENLKSIVFSVHGFSEKTYNKLMNNLDRDKTYSNILRFVYKRNLITTRKNPLKIAVSFVRTTENIHEFDDFMLYWKQHVDEVHNFELMNWNNTVYNYDNLVDKPKLNTRACPMYENPMVIDVFGNVVRCCYNVSFSYGNVFENGVTNYLLKIRESDTYPDFDCIKCDGWKV